MNPRLPLLFALLGGLAAAPALAGSAVVRFVPGELNGWQVKSFQGETTYTPGRIDGRSGLHAEAKGTASGLFREQRIDLTQTPVIVWDWRVDALPQNGPDERSKAGDDFAARVYVVISGGVAFWKTRTLVYVWAAREPAGAHWDNPFTGNAKMLVLRSGPKDLHHWQHETRNLAADLRTAFGEDIPAVDAVAIMTDMDNSGRAAEAWYGDIEFRAAP